MGIDGSTCKQIQGGGRRWKQMEADESRRDKWKYVEYSQSKGSSWKLVEVDQSISKQAICFKLPWQFPMDQASTNLY